ncbi:unnamed protein product [Rotaria sp. Silwood1]|nr:unnamed protein product [Rotaria sp. Silwood1]CAF1632984.1 unnamed protein product [Rotaria sp. Silwood1]CAF3806654.1 unnamed protein product [Rotaria sp. Silwood1]CAF3855339.1 unnamed protein product [Rotaria sp. Silwood1]CAF3875829.1 unnamed protein product [Rotaria sp. Silwood1]
MTTSSVAEIKPSHVIIWLDKNMGVSQNNRTSKKDLASNANVDCIPSNERSYDINNLIRFDDPNMNDEQWNSLIQNVLQMFTDEESCIKFIDDNLIANKQPFLIVSGQMGVTFMPRIHTKLSGYIYVFCGQRHLHEWTDEYLKHIEVYDDESGVFAKVLADIGIYHFRKSEETLNKTNAIKYLEWARRLFMRAIQLDHIKRTDYLNMIDKALTELKASQLNDDNDDQAEKIGHDADEG